MKGTSHKILSVILALVLVVSMFATVIAPASAVTAATVVVANSPTTAGAAAQWTVTFDHTALAPIGTVISITFPSGVVLPSTVSYQYVRFGTNTTGPLATGAEAPLASTNPAPVVVGNTLQIQIPAAITGTQFGSITISQLAGIKNPNLSNTDATGALVNDIYKVTVASSVIGEAAATSAVGFTVTRSVSLSPTAASVGGAVTVSGVGFAANSSIDLTGSVAGSGTTDDSGTFTVTGSAATGGTVTATDGSGRAATSTATLTITPNLTVTPTTAEVGDVLTVTGTGFTVGNHIALSIADQPVSIASLTSGAAALNPGGLTITAPANTYTTIVLTATSFNVGVVVPPGTTAGTKTVAARVIAATPATYGTPALFQAVPISKSTTFTVGARTVALSVASGQTGTTVIVTGTGFEGSTAGAPVTANITLRDAATTVTGNLLTTAASIDANGTFTASIVIPVTSGAGGTPASTALVAGAGRITATSSAGSTGVATFTILPATLAISPTSGGAGTSVTLTGTGFTPYTTFNSVSIDAVGAATVALIPSVIVGADGAFTATFVWPGLAAGAHQVRIGAAALPVVTYTQTAGSVAVSAGFNSIVGKYSVVWTFDGATQSWKLYDVNAPAVSDLSTLARGQGYWMQCTEAATMVYGGNVYNLVAGWNLIGWLG